MPTNAGCDLEVVADERLVRTNALGPEYRPRGGGFITATMLLEPEGDVAIALHATPEKKQHEEMGLFDGWSTVLDQLVALVKTWES